MNIFILLILHRAFSGIKNGGGYAAKKWLCLLGTALTIITPVVYALNGQTWQVQAISAAIGAFPILEAYALLYNRPKWVHALEFATTWSFPLVFIGAGGNILLPVLAYPLGNVLFKGFVNLGVKRPFIDLNEMTNDPTGKTVNVFILGFELKIPRIHDGLLRLNLGIAGVFLYLLNAFTINIGLYLNW